MVSTLLLPTNFMPRRGFTLIEMLVTFLILGIVAAVGINAYINMRDDAITRTVAGRLHQLMIAKEQFITEYGRLEAERIWRTPQTPTANYLVPAMANGQNDTLAERQYNLLKRYIERPQAVLAEFLPAGTTLTTPLNVHGTYTGRDNRSRTITLVR